MKLIDLINVMQPLNKLMQLNYTNFTVVRNLAKLKKNADEEIKFYIEQETKIREKYKVGTEEFEKDAEAIEKCKTELIELQNTEVDDFESKVILKTEDFARNSDIPTPEELIRLDIVIDWE